MGLPPISGSCFESGFAGARDGQLPYVEAVWEALEDGVAVGGDVDG